MKRNGTERREKPEYKTSAQSNASDRGGIVRIGSHNTFKTAKSTLWRFTGRRRLKGFRGGRRLK